MTLLNHKDRIERLKAEPCADLPTSTKKIVRLKGDRVSAAEKRSYREADIVINSRSEVIKDRSGEAHRRATEDELKAAVKASAPAPGAAAAPDAPGGRAHGRADRLPARGLWAGGADGESYTIGSVACWGRCGRRARR